MRVMGIDPGSLCTGYGIVVFQQVYQAQKGLLLVNADAMGEDEMLELVLEAGGDDLQKVDERFEITTSVENFESVQKALEEKNVPVAFGELTAIPQNTVSVDEKNGRSLLRLIDLLEDHDDVQKAYSNFDIPDEVMAALEQDS